MLQYSAISGPRQGVVEVDRPPPDIATGENVDYCSLVGLDSTVTVNRAGATDGCGGGPPLADAPPSALPSCLDLPTQPEPEPKPKPHHDPHTPTYIPLGCEDKHGRQAELSRNVGLGLRRRRRDQCRWRVRDAQPLEFGESRRPVVRVLRYASRFRTGVWR